MSNPTSSTLATVKARVVALLAARAGLAGVTVSYAWAGPSETVEGVWLGDTTDWQMAYPVTGNVSAAREESYRFEIVVNVVQEGGTSDTAATTEARAIALFAEVEAVVGVDRTLGVAGVLQAGLVNVQPPKLTPASAGWACRIVSELEVNAWLQPAA